MTRLAARLFTLLVIASWSSPSQAQDDAAKPADATGTAEAEAGATVNVPSLDDPISDPLLEGDKSGSVDDPLADKSGKPGAPAAAVKQASAAQDIVVVPRKDFLKSGRVELAPLTGITVNDNLIRHYGFGGDLTYFLTDVFGVGLQGMYMVKERSDREGLIGLQYNRTAALNRYNWQASLNFSYIPVYGKFALFNRNIVHWDLFVSGGVGATQSEIIPRKPSDESFSSINITPNVGVGARVYLNDWLTFNIALRDYIFPDKFEPKNRKDTDSIETVKSNAEGQLVNNVMVYAGLGFYLPTSFTYRTPR